MESATQNSFEDLSFAFFLALKGTGTPTRVLATNMADLGPPGSRWDRYGEDFTRSVPKQYINIICGDNGELVRLFTVGVPNIAITASWNGAPTDDEVTSLQLYDAVLCPSRDEAQVYQTLGVLAVHVEPHPAVLASLIRGFI